MLSEVVRGDPIDVGSGSRLLHCSRTISQGAHVSGEIKGIIPKIKGKPIRLQADYHWCFTGEGFGLLCILECPENTQGSVQRCGVKSRLQSLMWCPKSDDLGLARAKCAERCMEARRSSDVQYLDLSWVSVEKSNLVRGWLVPPKVGRSQASEEVRLWCRALIGLVWRVKPPPAS